MVLSPRASAVFFRTVRRRRRFRQARALTARTFHWLAFVTVVGGALRVMHLM